MYNPTFIGDIDLNEETLTHYGVKGMKWRRRKGKKEHEVDTEHARDAYRRRVKSEQRKRREKYYAQKMADDLMDGRSQYINGSHSDTPGMRPRNKQTYVVGAPGTYAISTHDKYHRGPNANKYANTDDVVRAVGERTLKRKKK